MAHIPLEFANGFYKSNVSTFSSQRCINMTPIAAENQAYGPVALFSVSGVTAIVPPPSLAGVSRGMTTMGGLLYVVNGDTLYRIDEDYTVNILGTITGSGIVSMANNNTKLCVVVPNGDAYVYDAGTSTFTQITSLDYFPSSMVVFKDGYYVFSASDGTKFFNSAINDPLTFNAISFGSAEINPDLITGLVVNHNQLYVTGEDSIELFATTGGSGFPFQRVQGGSSQKGVYSPYSTINFNNDWVFVGGGYNERASIWAMNSSSQIYNISTDTIDSQIKNFTREEIKNKCYSVTYSEANQRLVAFTFIAENQRVPSITLVYNSTASEKLGKRIWFERQTGYEGASWRVNNIQEAYGLLITGDITDSHLGFLDRSSQLEFNDPMVKEFSTMPFSNLDYSMFFGMLELTCQTGVGLNEGLGEDPYVYMSFSDDGGNTFNTPMGRPLGKIGEYTKRIQWRRQGRTPQDRCLKFKTTDPVLFNVIGLTTVVTGGTQ